MEAARFSCARFDNEDILYVCQYMIYRPLYYVSQARGYLASHSNSDSNGSSKTYTPCLSPYSFFCDDSFTRIPSNIDCPQCASAPLLYPLIPTPAIAAVVMDGISNDNAAFGVEAKSDTVGGN